MKKNRLAWPTCLLLVIFFITSCGGAQLRKEQAEASRKLGEAYILDGNFTRALQELLKAEKQYPDDLREDFDKVVAEFKPDFGTLDGNLVTESLYFFS